MNRVLRAIGHFVKHSAIFVKDSFVSLFGSDAAHSFAVAAESLLHSALGQIAWAAVSEMAALQLSGAEKRAGAFDRIVTKTKDAGITAENSIINLLIETAVQKLNGTFGPEPTQN